MSPKEIKCTDCGRWFPYPNEWKDLNDMDKAYLEDGFMCERCEGIVSHRQYFNNGMAELDGYM